MLKWSHTGRHRKVVVTLGLGREVLGNQACSVVVKKHGVKENMGRQKVGFI